MVAEGFTSFQERLFWKLVTRGFTLAYQNDLVGILALDKHVDGRVVRVIIGRDYALVPKAGGGWVRLRGDSPARVETLLQASC